MNELKPENVMKVKERCVDCLHYEACRDWANGWGIETNFPYEAERNLCEQFQPKTILREKDARIEHLEKTMKESILSNTELLENLNRLVDEKDAEIEKLKREINGEVEDDFPNCSISGCEAADAVCHLTCPYSKELADLKRDAIAHLKEKGIDGYIYAMEYDEDGTPYFAFTFDEELVKEAKEIWDNGEVLMGCYDEFAYGNTYEEKLNDMCKTIIYRYEYERKQNK